ncbi:hypothetical protein ABZ484_24360 [Streptomyces sp. NPDC006393]|uniref:hypothetical protein n=1 Tax=Streptomyces sp. NPDC006393 TaxID=3156763 RepID=UPI00340DF035
MHRLPAARLLPACVLCTAALLTATACTPGSGDASASAAAATGPAGSVTPGATATLTAAQAQAALLTEADLGAPWAPTQGAATWRDGVLKARTTVPGCQRLLDALYSDQPLGAPTGTYAVTGFDDGDDSAQLRYQVLSQRPADVDRALAWLRTLPEACSRFTATTTRSGEQDVRVTALDLPDVGDARQGLRITFTSQSNTGGDSYDSYDSDEWDEGDERNTEPTTTLTLEVAAVRVGSEAIALTEGAPGALPPNVTAHAVQSGTQRLTDVRRSARAQA